VAADLVGPGGGVGADEEAFEKRLLAGGADGDQVPTGRLRRGLASVQLVAVSKTTR